MTWIYILIEILAFIGGLAFGFGIKWSSRKNKKYDGTLLLGPSKACMNVSLSLDDLMGRESIELKIDRVDYDDFMEVNCNGGM